MSKKKKPISINIRCQCEDPAVKRPESLLVTVHCRGCGKASGPTRKRTSALIVKENVNRSSIL